MIITGLAAVLAGFVFIGNNIPAGYAADGPPFESDSVILERHKHEMRVEYTVEEFSDHSFNSHLTDDDMDSIMQDQRSSFVSANMYYSPDSAFRIAVLEIRSCGGSCNSDWYSWLHFNDGSGLVIKNPGYHDITGIYSLPDGKYLIIDSDEGGFGTYSCHSYAAEVISLEDHVITRHPIPDKREGHIVTGNYSFGVSSCTYMPDACSLTFESENNTMHYAYSDDPGPSAESDSVTVHSGIYFYADTSFIIKKYEDHKIKYRQE